MTFLHPPGNSQDTFVYQKLFDIFFNLLWLSLFLTIDILLWFGWLTPFNSHSTLWHCPSTFCVHWHPINTQLCILWKGKKHLLEQHSTVDNQDPSIWPCLHSYLDGNVPFGKGSHLALRLGLNVEGSWGRKEGKGFAAQSTDRVKALAEKGERRRGWRYARATERVHCFCGRVQPTCVVHSWGMRWDSTHVRPPAFRNITNVVQPPLCYVQNIPLVGNEILLLLSPLLPSLRLVSWFRLVEFSLLSQLIFF